MDHAGCRVCGRTDITLKRDKTLYNHVRADLKGSSFLNPNTSRCTGTGHPPKGELGTYAQDVIDTLIPHFPDLEKPHIAEVIGESIQQHHIKSNPALECILDASSNWRLKPDAFRINRVRIACYKLYANQADRDRENSLTALLKAIP